MSKLQQEENIVLQTPAPLLLDRLRLETNTLHKRLEDDLDLLGSGLNATRYRETLARFYGYYQPFEERLFAALPDRLQSLFKGRRKVANLERDLIFFGVSTGDLPICSFVPDVTRFPDLLGSLYVFEGATLGGQFISRHLETDLGLRNSEGCAFFSGYGSETGSKWKSFRAALLNYSSPQIDDKIIAAAQNTFDTMHRWLCPAKVHS